MQWAPKPTDVPELKRSGQTASRELDSHKQTRTYCMPDMHHCLSNAMHSIGQSIKSPECPCVCPTFLKFSSFHLPFPFLLPLLLPPSLSPFSFTFFFSFSFPFPLPLFSFLFPFPFSFPLPSLPPHLFLSVSLPFPLTLSLSFSSPFLFLFPFFRLSVSTSVRPIFEASYLLNGAR